MFRFDGTLPIDAINKYQSTNFIHDGVVMTTYENEPFIVGDYNHNQVEILSSNLLHSLWLTLSPFPFSGEQMRIFGYSPVARPGKVKGYKEML